MKGWSKREAREVSRREFVRDALLALGGAIVSPFLPSCRGSASQAPPPYRIYWGDLHLHTSPHHRREEFAAAFSSEAIAVAHAYARDVKGHDFIAVTNHDSLLTSEMWEAEQRVADEWTEQGVFISLPAYEWTASRSCRRKAPEEHLSEILGKGWGHRCVYWRRTPAPLFRCNDYDTDKPEELLAALSQVQENEALTIPHHPADKVHPFYWPSFDPQWDREVEIIQKRGDYEANCREQGWDTRRYFGVVGGSDNHRGKAGEPQKAGETQGVTAILAPHLTREDLFEALRARHTYAATRPTIILHFFAGDAIQGDILPAQEGVELRGRIESLDSPIDLVELIEDGSVIAERHPAQRSFEFDLPVQTSYMSHYFYLRVTLESGDRAWSSPIFVSSGL